MPSAFLTDHFRPHASARYYGRDGHHLNQFYRVRSDFISEKLIFDRISNQSYKGQVGEFDGLLHLFALPVTTPCGDGAMGYETAFLSFYAHASYYRIHTSDALQLETFQKYIRGLLSRSCLGI